MGLDILKFLIEKADNGLQIVLLLALVGILVFGIAYIRQKATNLASKEDVQSINRAVEQIRSDYSVYSQVNASYKTIARELIFDLLKSYADFELYAFFQGTGPFADVEELKEAAYQYYRKLDALHSTMIGHTWMLEVLVDDEQLYETVVLLQREAIHFRVVYNNHVQRMTDKAGSHLADPLTGDAFQKLLMNSTRKLGEDRSAVKDSLLPLQDSFKDHCKRVLGALHERPDGGALDS